MHHLLLTFQLQQIICIEDRDGPRGANPYLWTVFFKIDGDTVRVTDNDEFTGAATVIATDSGPANLEAQGVRAGDVLPIPRGVGHWETSLVPIQPASDPAAPVGGLAGVLVVLWEADQTPRKAADAGYAALVSGFRSGLDALVPALQPGAARLNDEQIDGMMTSILGQVDSAIRGQMGLLNRLANWDDRVGYRLFHFAHNALEAKTGSGVLMMMDWESKGAWRFNGQILVHQPDAAPPPASQTVP